MYEDAMIILHTIQVSAPSVICNSIAEFLSMNLVVINIKIQRNDCITSLEDKVAIKRFEIIYYHTKPYFKIEQKVYWSSLPCNFIQPCDTHNLLLGILLKHIFSVLDDDKSISAENNENKTHLYKRLSSVWMNERVCLMFLPTNGGIHNYND